LAVNIGAFIGAAGISFLGESFGWVIGFVVAGLMFLLSIVFVVLTAEVKLSKLYISDDVKGDGILKIIIVIGAVAIFWGVYDFFGYRTYDIQNKFTSMIDIPFIKEILASLNALFMIPFGVILIITWSYFYSKPFIKMIIGFIFGVLGFAVLFLIPETPSEGHLIIYVISTLFLAITEYFIGPMVYSIITKYSNPKYIAIFIALSFIPSKLVSFIVSFFNLPSDNVKYQYVGVFLLAVITIGLIIYYVVSNSNQEKFSGLIDQE